MEIKILAGCSGSGKSTYIKNNYPAAKVVSSDLYPGLYEPFFDPTKLAQSHGWCLRQYIEAIQDGIKFGFDGVIAVDNTNTTVGEIAPYAAIASAYGIPFEIVVIATDPSVAGPRNAHGVPQKGVERQYNRMLQEHGRLPSYWPHRTVR